MGLIRLIGDTVANLVLLADPSHRIMVAIILILWVSAFASAFIDNIPYTTTMIPVIVQLTEDPNLQLPLLPLAWVCNSFTPILAASSFCFLFFVFCFLFFVFCFLFFVFIYLFIYLLISSLGFSIWSMLRRKWNAGGCIRECSDMWHCWTSWLPNLVCSFPLPSSPPLLIQFS